MDWFGRYAAFVRKHQGALTAAEQVASAASWLVVGGERLDVWLEAASATLGVWGTCNRHVLAAEEGAPIPPWPLWLALVEQVELLAEMSAERSLGDEKKWAVVAWVEAVKAALRVRELGRTRGTMLIDGGATPNEEGGSRDQRSTFSRVGGSCVTAASPEVLACAVQRFRQRHCVSALAPSPSVTNLTTSTPVGSVLTRWESPDGRALGAELIRVVRPVLYVLMIRRYGARSWTPWTTSLLLDLAALRLMHDAPSTSSEQEKEETKRRRMMLLYYLLRTPAFELFTHPPLKVVHGALKPLPIVGFLLDRAVDLTEELNSKHFYSAP
mmetsp:Transcript_21878/g.70678  ORF Transcript_21878/g.70678 Transcript_21878/m.70678 type:complete len:326 (+) Transcript_21878:1353-2330(+)